MGIGYCKIKGMQSNIEDPISVDIFICNVSAGDKIHPFFFCNLAHFFKFCKSMIPTGSPAMMYRFVHLVLKLTYFRDCLCLDLSDVAHFLGPSDNSTDN